MKNKNIALVGLVVLILVGAGSVLFSGKTTLFKGKFGVPGEKDGKGREPVSAEDCTEDDRSCWAEVRYNLEDAVSRQEISVREVKQGFDAQQAVVTEKTEALKRQARAVELLEKNVTIAKKKVQQAEKKLEIARRRRDPGAITRAEEELRAAEAELQTAQRDAQNARDQYNVMKKELDAATEEFNRLKVKYDALNNLLIRLRNQLKAAKEAYEHAWEVFVPDWRFCYDTHQLSFETELPDIYDAPLEKCRDLFPELMTGLPDIRRCARMLQKEREGTITPGDQRLLDSCRNAYPDVFANFSEERCRQYHEWAVEGTLTDNGYDGRLFMFCEEIYQDIMYPGSGGAAEEPTPRGSGPGFGTPSDEEPAESPPAEELPSP